MHRYYQRNNKIDFLSTNLLNEKAYRMHMDFPGGSDDKEHTCNAGDLGSIPGWGRSPEKEMATHSSILCVNFLANLDVFSFSHKRSISLWNLSDQYYMVLLLENLVAN